MKLPPGHSMPFHQADNQLSQVVSCLAGKFAFTGFLEYNDSRLLWYDVWLNLNFKTDTLGEKRVVKKAKIECKNLLNFINFVFPLV